MTRALPLALVAAAALFVVACDGDSFVTPMPIDRSKPPHDFAIPYVFDGAGLDLTAIEVDLAAIDEAAASPDLEPQD